MKTAVMYGAGNIGRGFIGTLFSASGYETVFVDVSAPVVEALNRDGEYPVRILSEDSFEDRIIRNVRAVDGTDPSAVAEAIAEADMMATAVGVNVLPKIVPCIVEGLRLRQKINPKPLNILICENLMDADKVLEGLIKSHLSPEESSWFDASVGLVETSIGRMVPLQTEEMKDGNPLRVCVERYDFLPVNKAAFKGEIPQIHNMIPFEPFDFYVKRKLYVHNMSHALCAYLGDLLGLEFIYQSIDRDEVYRLVRGAMEESILALSRKYSVPLGDLSVHVEDLLYRFTNKALKDTCKRVGNDAKRKLSPADRLVGALNLAWEQGVNPVYLSVGVAAALFRYFAENGVENPSREDAVSVLRDHCKLSPDFKPMQMILDYYEKLVSDKDLPSIRRAVDAEKAALRGAIV
ncbi:MAG: mannitol dehydrogenase [Clostridia bacterium]|nr:mannitol dehydrogenase [Clostridia bacterium]